ncbi:MAG: hypothetical protein PVJ57_11360 [Phycisphaerae bacterium]|jgi:2,4-dienoyl-CoA reductase-like NADH-dependent reductase (Old Yellow Enzyme family)
MTAPARTRHGRFPLGGKDALLKLAADLGVDLPWSDDVRVLLTPLEVAGRRLSNRLVILPMEGRDALADGAPGPLTCRRYERYGAGGAGLIWAEATAVVPDGRASPLQLHLTRDNLPAFRELTQRTRAAAHQALGSQHTPLLVLQLAHSGRYSRPDGTPHPAIAQHNPILDPRHGLAPTHPLVTDDDFAALQKAYVTSARLAAEAGFDAVDVKACHGYLIAELLGARSRSSSRFGGDFDSRIRWLLETVAFIRAELPDLLVTCRLGGHDGLPLPLGFGAGEGNPPAEDLREPAELVRRLAAAGCPLLAVSAGIPYYNPHYGRPFDTPLPGAAPPAEHPLVGVERLLRIVAAMQHAAPNTPIIGCGYTWLRHLFPHVAAAVVERSQATLIGLGRMAFAYPSCPRDLAERGTLDPRQSCTTCSRCTQLMRDGANAGCVVRDAEIYGPIYRRRHADPCEEA